jgi:hypothetical protein
MTRAQGMLLALAVFALIVGVRSVIRDYRDYRDEYETQAHFGAFGDSPPPPRGFRSWVKYLVTRGSEPEPEPDPVGDVDQPTAEHYDWGVIGREDAAPRHSAGPKPGPARNEALLAWVTVRLAEGAKQGNIVRHGVLMFGCSESTVKRYIRMAKGEE